MVSFREARNLSSHLVRAKIAWIIKCNGECFQVCMNVTEGNIFYSSVYKREYVINHGFNCNDKCIIYLLTCNKCKLPYVGKTVDDFHLRWNNFKDNRKYLTKKACLRTCDTYLITFQVRVIESLLTVIFLKTFLLPFLIKLILKILPNGDTTGGIPLKQWHLKVWM